MTDKEDLGRWCIYYKLDNDSEEWNMFDSYDNKETALNHASKLPGNYFLIKVTDPDGSAIWIN